MILIPTKVILPTSGDVFEEIREFYNTTNPLQTSHLNIKASSTHGFGSLNRSDISCLIREPELCRWISSNLPNSNFTIDFKRNRVELLGYSLQTMVDYRFINSWSVLAYKPTQWDVIDQIIDHPLCTTSGSNNNCDTTQEHFFTLDKPIIGSKFAIVHTGLDSYNDHYFSLSYLRLFGVINPYTYTLPISIQCYDFFVFFSLIIFIIEYA